MKLEVGMYVRNNHFGIGKINKEYFDSNNKHWFNVQFNCYKDEDCHCGICEETMGFKASYNIIDLIQVGDYVNGYPVYEIIEYEDNIRAIVIGDDNKSIIWEESSQYIKSIVTKEQFKSVECEV